MSTALLHTHEQVWAHMIDVQYLRPIFERYPDAVDDEIMHTFKKLQYRYDGCC